MPQSDYWLLPEGIEELLPAEAQRLEQSRRKILALFDSWGYDQVVPPLVDYLDSLLVGTGNDLESSTFKLIDSVSGRLVGVRADMTPQVARIDAHRLQREAPVRLCYLGPVLLTQARELGGSRNPFQVGAELYGHAGLEADFEVVQLMLEALAQTGFRQLFLDLGHVEIFRILAQEAKLTETQEDQLFDALQRKAKPEIRQLMAGLNEGHVATMLEGLVDLNGGVEVFAAARALLAKAPSTVTAALSELEQLYQWITQKLPQVTVHVDLAELRGYRYHNGVVYAAYVPGYGQSVAGGGRYDGIGQVFGRLRPATGFSMDLRTIIGMSAAPKKLFKGIFAPAVDDAELARTVAELRAQGERVVKELLGQTASANASGCNRQLVKQNNRWVVEQLETQEHE